ARQHLHAVHAGQPDIQQHQFETAAGQRLQARLAAGRGLYRVALVFQHAAQGLADPRLVIHYPNPSRFHIFTAEGFRSASAAGGGGSFSSMAGSSTVKRAPTGWLSSTRMVPLCSATMWLTMARPKPVPRFLVEKYGRKSLSLSSLLTPAPESATTTSTVSAAPGWVEMYSVFTRESCMASAALSTRFTTTRWNCSRSTFTAGRFGAKLVRMEMSSRRP